MSSTLVTERYLTLRGMIPLLTLAAHDTCFHSSILLQPNTLSDSDALSILCYTLVTSPESTHAWIVFKFFHEDALKASAGANVSSIIPTTTFHSTSFTFPSSSFLADISKNVVEFWKALAPDEIMDWAEFARDIRNAHTQLVASFGNGIIFDGKDWEE
ncbi:hypothetical protein CPB86DRAFT_872964 [Serendipita vermifera]|nr:hypothetical protein CPB86DRAFT_872964 [Serendipita vermifera]